MPASEFVFKPPPPVSRARRVLIKPSAGCSLPYPVTTSPGILSTIIEGIRQVSDADILLLEGTPTGEPIHPVYKALHYNFPRVLRLDVKDCISVEVDNPLTKPYLIPTFSVPNVVLSSDYLITVAPLKVIKGVGNLSITNLLSLLPRDRYRGVAACLEPLTAPDLDKVIADLYFTLPFDLGVIDGRQELTAGEGTSTYEVKELGKVFIGEPYEIDCEASDLLGLKTDYLDLIEAAKVELES